jgi:hypothetical protein
MTQLQSAIQRIAVAVTVLALAGCAVGPNFSAPAAPEVDR